MPSTHTISFTKNGVPPEAPRICKCHEVYRRFVQSRIPAGLQGLYSTATQPCKPRASDSTALPASSTIETDTSLSLRKITYAEIPRDLLNEIFQYLPLTDLLNAYNVCRSWRINEFDLLFSLLKTIKPELIKLQATLRRVNIADDENIGDIKSDMPQHGMDTARIKTSYKTANGTFWTQNLIQYLASHTDMLSIAKAFAERKKRGLLTFLDIALNQDPELKIVLRYYQAALTQKFKDALDSEELIQKRILGTVLTVLTLALSYYIYLIYLGVKEEEYPIRPTISPENLKFYDRIGHHTCFFPIC